MPPAIQWIVTTQTAPWQSQPSLTMQPPTSMPGVFVRTDMPLQTIQGFGACFNELGWDALNDLSAADRASIMHELFAPGVGANFTICRMPMGANDFSRDWYSYTETPGDFTLADFTIAHDHDTLIPFIKNALQYQPALQLWASPWSPPTWMKHNQHYAAALPSPLQVGVDNGLRADQVGAEGSDMFIQDERYYAAYARYFGRFIDEYRALGIDIGMVMPQNEFNSPQVFPSCTWTPTGLARFLAHLGPDMAARAVDGRIEVVTQQDPAVELRQITPEEAALQRANHHAEQLRKMLWLYEHRRMPRGAVLNVLSRAPRSLAEFEAAAKVLRFGSRWGAQQFAQQQRAQQQGDAPARRRRSGRSWVERAMEGFVSAA